MNKYIVYFIIFVFGWLSGIIHSYVANAKRFSDEMMVIDTIEGTMEEGKPFVFLDKYKFQPINNGGYVVTRRQ